MITDSVFPCSGMMHHLRNFRTLRINVLPVSSLLSLQNSVFNISGDDNRLSFGHDSLMSCPLLCPKVPAIETTSYSPLPLTILGFSL
jgi:hypothetical protein